MTFTCEKVDEIAEKVKKHEPLDTPLQWATPTRVGNNPSFLLEKKISYVMILAIYHICLGFGQIIL